jgi:hypothetical protein
MKIGRILNSGYYFSLFESVEGIIVLVEKHGLAKMG